MTLSDINAKISFLTSQDSTAGGYPNADRLISINNYYNRINTALLQSQDEVEFDDQTITTSYPIGKRDLVANQQDYKFNTALWALATPEGGADLSASTIAPFKLRRVELSYDGGTTWNKAEPLQRGEKSTPSDQTSINNQFQTTKPFYSVEYGAIWTYPIPVANSSKGMKLYFDRQVTEFTLSDLTTGTKSPGFDANFHMILAYGPAYEFAIANGKSNLDETKKELEQLMQELRVFTGSKDSDRSWGLKANFVPYT
jgi:hypothetical protein